MFRRCPDQRSAHSATACGRDCECGCGFHCSIGRALALLVQPRLRPPKRRVDSTGVSRLAPQLRCGLQRCSGSPQTMAACGPGRLRRPPVTTRASHTALHSSGCSSRRRHVATIDSDRPTRRQRQHRAVHSSAVAPEIFFERFCPKKELACGGGLGTASGLKCTKLVGNMYDCMYPQG